ncbi:MAG: Fe(2+) transporter permease subunit FeoB [Gammaproteobacteria bacterium]
MIEIALIGNPNSGKTTLFNALTGANQRVGNWPGVTVERKEGFFSYQNERIKAIDLPGTYSLTMGGESSLDERVACDYLLSHRASLVVNVCDASNLERSLYLTVQLLEMGLPVIVALNMMDIAQKRKMRIDVDVLSKELGCPVVILPTNKKRGCEKFKESLVQYANESLEQNFQIQYSPHVDAALGALAAKLDQHARPRWCALRLLEDDSFAKSQFSNPELQKTVDDIQSSILQQSEQDADILIADARYQFITAVIKKAVKKSFFLLRSLSHKLDAIVLNRVLGIPIFLMIMYALFFVAINVGGAFQDFFDIASDVIFIQGAAHVLQVMHMPPSVVALLAQGVGRGINTVVTFIPVIATLFFCLAILEQSGYMARAAFVMDRLMRAIGLPGKSFVPMIIGFGCNVPAVMASRTLESRRDRVLTILMSPFMSCGARLAIFTVFTAAFFPHSGANVVFSLYFIGILVAIVTGLILRKTLLKGEPSPLIMELPEYHTPHLSTLLIHTWHRLRGFVVRAGKLIIPVCILLGVLNSLTVQGHFVPGGSEHSLLAMLGRMLTPLFAPMGVHADNWPATVGLLTGVLAKEVVVGTLNTLYTSSAHLTQMVGHVDIWLGIKQAFHSIAENLHALAGAIVNPFAASMPEHTMTQTAMGQMMKEFDGAKGAFAYLLFVLLYFPCISTTAAITRELNRRWAIFSMLWATGIAYGTAVIFYQAATFMLHPMASLAWIIGIVIVFLSTIVALKYVIKMPDLPILSGCASRAKCAMKCQGCEFSIGRKFEWAEEVV